MSITSGDRYLTGIGQQGEAATGIDGNGPTNDLAARCRQAKVSPERDALVPVLIEHLITPPGLEVTQLGIETGQKGAHDLESIHIDISNRREINGPVGDIGRWTLRPTQVQPAADNDHQLGSYGGGLRQNSRHLSFARLLTLTHHQHVIWPLQTNSGRGKWGERLNHGQADGEGNQRRPTRVWTEQNRH